MIIKQKYFKFIIISLFFILFLFSSKVLAATVVTDPPIDDTNKYYVVWCVDDVYYCVVTSYKVDYQDYNNNENFWIDSSSPKLFYKYNGSSWEKTTVPNSYYGSNYIVFQYRQNYGLSFASTICASNYDIVFTNNKNAVFFQHAPLPIVKGEVAQVMDKVEMQVTLQEIIQIIPLILVVVVSLVGLRKGLSLLLTILHRS